MEYVAPYKEIEGLPTGYVFQDVLDVVLKSRLGTEILRTNGLDASGWDVLTTLRHRLEGDLADVGLPGLPFVVVTTKVVRARLIGAKPIQTIDLMQKRSDKILFWWEFDKAKSHVVRNRRCVDGFEASMMNLDTGKEFFAIIAVAGGRAEYDALVEGLKAADVVEMSGMWVDTSMDKKEQVFFMLVNKFVCKVDDYSGAENVLRRLRDWRQLAPSRNVSTGELMFSDEVLLAMMMGALFYREGSPALNIIAFGPPNTGKTSCLEFLAVHMMRGSFEAATASSGKGWLVTHKDGVVSKVFSERRVMLVDEFFKAASSVGAKANFHSYALELNSFMEKHMQLLEKRELDATSGLGTIKGRMRCSFLGSENNNESLQKALARADSMSGGPMRRLQFAYVDEVRVEDVFEVKQSSAVVVAYMKSYFYKMFGGTALKDISSLFMYSRGMTTNHTINAPDWWKRSMMMSLYKQVECGAEGVPREFVQGVGDDSGKLDRVKGYVLQHQEAMNACWVCAGIMRGWEVYDSLDALQPVFDLKAQRMAELVAEFLFISKLRVLAPGINESSSTPAYISRV